MTSKYDPGHTGGAGGSYGGYPNPSLMARESSGYTHSSYTPSNSSYSYEQPIHYHHHTTYYDASPRPYISYVPSFSGWSVNYNYYWERSSRVNSAAVAVLLACLVVVSMILLAEISPLMWSCDFHHYFAFLEYFDEKKSSRIFIILPI